MPDGPPREHGDPSWSPPRNTTDQPGAGVLLEVSDLSVDFLARGETIHAVSKVSFAVLAGESVAIVGQSGSGKSTLVQAIMQILPPNATIESGRILFEGTDLVTAPTRELDELRGAAIGLVPQDPLTNLDPLMRIGKQVVEGARRHGTVARGAAKRVAVESLNQTGVPNPRHVSRQYPVELSGGMRQRALIASATTMHPRLLIADEPTSALDVTVQKRILDQLIELVSTSGTAFMFVTHDLALAAERAHRVLVMYQGEIVETGPAAIVLTNPNHEYTRRLVAAVPALHSTRLIASRADVSGEPPRLEIWNLLKTYRSRDDSGARTTRAAVDRVSACVGRGETLAVVGESGSGKTTLARAVLRLLRPDGGQILYGGTDILTLRGAALRKYRRLVQPIFQDPSGSLNPRFSVYDAIVEPFVIQGVGDAETRRRRVAELLDQVELPSSASGRRTTDLSGGQKQRVAIARALALVPETLVCDEVVSALDVIVQEQILELLATLQRELGLTYLFISHDLAVVRQVADRVIVMQHGKVVEEGTCDRIFAEPAMDYTRELIAAIPGQAIA